MLYKNLPDKELEHVLFIRGILDRSPLDTENVIGTNPNTGAEEDRKPSDDEKTSALAFKIATDPYVGRLTCLLYTSRCV